MVEEEEHHGAALKALASSADGFTSTHAIAETFATLTSGRLEVQLTRMFHTSGFGAPIFNRLSAPSRPRSRLQVGAPDCWHFVRIMKYAG
jgi:hypothetical protein